MSSSLLARPVFLLPYLRTVSRHHLLAKHPRVAYWESEGPKPFFFPPVVFIAKAVSLFWGEKIFHLQAHDH
jgi:hypothetical protein